MATVHVRVVLRRHGERRRRHRLRPASIRGCALAERRRCSRCATCASPSAPRTGSCAPSTACRSRVAPGEVLGIVGESGSGKSVTVMSIMRLIRDPNARLRGRGALQGPRPAQARPAPDARGPRLRDRDDLPGPDDVAEPGLPRRLADRRADARARAGLARPPRTRARDRAAAPGRHPRAASCASTTTRTSSPAACASAR